MTPGVACKSCGTALQDGARFCHGCGAPTAIFGAEAKYKQVTVLFADVVRSMEIAATLDMERLREIMTDLVERAAAVVRRYGGTAEYNGDGVMALFGAPVALEDHAFRACLAALAIQQEAVRLATEVENRDAVQLQLRVGLNSGRVIAGDIGSGLLGYAAFGEQVGLAQRMESVAPPGGVMLSESTARLVENVAKLGDREWVQIKGSDVPQAARRLIALDERRGPVQGVESSLVGRQEEMDLLQTALHSTIGGGGVVVDVQGPPGIGKSRVTREAAALAASSGIEVFWTFCESHARDVPFGVVTRLLRTAIGVADVDSEAARAQSRARMEDADPNDLLLLDDLLGIADPAVPLPQIDPDARRRRLTALINAASVARNEPALFIIEDVHWIDAVSESMLADFLTVIPHTPSMVLITARPEYDGVLAQVPGAHTIILAPLDDSESTSLIGEMLGSDSSLSELAAIISERAAGNPFFAEEMVRELVQRGALVGDRGGYVCDTDISELSVPATVQAAIEARIDRLNNVAKQTLNAASVIGERFDAQLLTALGVDPVLGELRVAELIDQVQLTPSPKYAFRHPLIRAVAYESQLKSDRAEWHRRLAAALQERAPESADDNAALIAEHLHAAGAQRAAYGWHMRAAAWSASRDPGAGWASWERARRIADAVPGDDPELLAMRIAPRTMLCVTVGWARKVHEIHDRFAELRELCNAAGDKLSLAIAMTGLVTEFVFSGQSPEGSRLASEQMELLESIGDPAPTVGLAFLPFCNWFDSGEMTDVLRWTQTTVELAQGDPTMGASFGFGSPLAAALAWRGTALWWLGRSGWRQDLKDALAMGQNSTPETLAAIVSWTYGTAIQYGVLRTDDFAVEIIEEAERATAGSNNVAVSLAAYTLAVALLNREAAADRDRGMGLMIQSREFFRGAGVPFLVPVAELWIARERAKRGGHDAVIPLMRQAVDELHQAGRLGYGVWGFAVLVETLLERGADDDVAEAQRSIDRLTNFRADQESAVRELMLLRLRALLSRARGDAITHRHFVIQYQAMADSLGFEAHVNEAEILVASLG